MGSEGGRVAGDFFAAIQQLIQIDVDTSLRHRVCRYAVDDVELAQTHMLRTEVLVDTDQLFVGFDRDGEKWHRV